MIPTLLVGDYLFVSKYSYGYSRFSLPFSPPLFSGRIFGSLPKRGDVVVFKYPPRYVDRLYQTHRRPAGGSHPGPRRRTLYQRAAISRQSEGTYVADDNGIRVMEPAV